MSAWSSRMARCSTPPTIHGSSIQCPGPTWVDGDHVMTRCAIRRTVLTALLAVALLPATADAQGDASITGVVRDASGAVLPGVTVQASSPALIEKEREVVSDGTG